MTTPSVCSARWWLATLAGLSTVLLPAQTAPSSEEEDEPIELSPFSVQGDSDMGYLATNSVTGTRLATEIQNVPLNLEILTSEFIQDTGSLDLRESLRYSAGVVLESQSDAFVDVDADPHSAGANDPRGVTRRVGESATKLRGFSGDQILRDGFRRQYSVDSINIERVEILRGPSALLYGVGNFGGVINFVPKRPIFDEERYHFGIAVGSHDLVRGEFDFTGPLVGEDSDWADWKPAYRLTGAAQSNGDYTEYYDRTQYVIAPSFGFRPTRSTYVLFENEFGFLREEGVGFQNIRNNVGDPGQSPGRQATWITDIFDIETGAKLGERVDNRSFRWSGPDTFLEGPFRNHIIDVEQRLGEDLLLKVGVGQSEATFDSRQIAGAGPKRGTFSGEQAYRGATLYGTVYDTPISRQQANAAPSVVENAVIQYEWRDYYQDQLRNQVRAELLYELDLNSWGRHTFLLGTQYMDLKAEADEYGPPHSYGGNPVALDERYSYKNPNDYSPFVYGTQGDGLPDNPRTLLYRDESKTWDLGYYGIYQGQFFNERLTLVGGARWDRSDARDQREFIYESNRETEQRSVVGGEAPTATSPQLGLSVKLMEGLSVFGVYSTGVVPNYYDRDGYGNIMDPTEAENLEVGVKLSLLDGKISGTISAYQIERTGQPKFVWWAPSPYQSELKGYDPGMPSTTVLWYATPDAFWYGLHNAEGMSIDQTTTLAKEMWPSHWHPLIDEIASSPQRQEDWAQYGPQAATFWDWAWEAEVNTNNQDYTGSFYFPLVNYSDPETLAFMEAIHQAPGWKGNYYYTDGLPYRYGDGATGYGNAPDGSGASVPMDDEANGWDVNLIFSPIPEFQMILNFSHVERKITTQTYRFVQAPYWPAASWFTSDNNYGTLDNTLTAGDVYDDVTDTTTYNQTAPDYNNAADDSPENTVSLWFRYDLSHLADKMSGWTVGGGGYWQDNRLWFTGFSGGGGNVTYVDGSRELVKLWTDERIILNAFVEYKTRIGDKYDLRVALNVNNLTDDEDLYGLVYEDGRSFRLFGSIGF